MKFEEMWPDMRYGTKRLMETSDILKGNSGICQVCGARTQFWDDIFGGNICSTECDEKLWELEEAKIHDNTQLLDL